MTYYGFGQIPTFFAPQGVGALAMQGNSALVGLPDMPIAVTTDWLMAGLLPTESVPSLMNTMSIPVPAAYRGDPWGNEPLSNGPQQWASKPTSLSNPRPKALSASPVSKQVTAANRTSKAPKGTAKQQALYQQVLAACNHLPCDAGENIARLIAYRECNANEADPSKARDIGDGAGLTAAGITQKYNPTLDFNNLTLKDIVDTYYEKYWVANNMDQYANNPVRQTMLFDACVGMGPKDMYEVDRIAHKKLHPTAKDYGRARLEVYKGKPNWEKFGPGWANRVNNELVPYAQSLASKPV